MTLEPVEAVCVLKKINQVTLTFSSPITRCDDVVQGIETEVNYFIGVDMDSGNWQVVAE